MAPGPAAHHDLDDPRLEGGEWLFRRGGQVFGPIDSRSLAAMLYSGELDGATPVSAGDGAWRPVAEVPIFLLHARKARAAVQVEREVTGARLIRERRHRRRTAALVAAALLLVAGAASVAFVVASRGPGTSPLLEDFGAGIGLASAARVGQGRRAAGDDLVDVPLDEAPPGSPARRPPAARARSAGAPAGEVEGGDLVAAPRYDAARIQAVVAREQRSLAACFRDEAARSPDFRGDVPLEFAVGNDGLVATLWIDEPRFRQGPLRECLLAALGRWRFDPFPGERPTVSLAFRIGR